MSKRHHYSEAEDEFLRLNASQYTREDLTTKFNEHFGTKITVTALSCHCQHMKLPSGGNAKGKVNPNFYPQEWIDFLQDNCMMPRKDLTDAFNKKFGTNKSEKAISSLCRKHKFLKGHIGPTEAQIAFIKENYYGISRKELTERFNEKFETNMTENALKSYCNNRGWFNGNDRRFQKGDEHWQTGLSKEEFRSHYTDESFDRMTEHLLDPRKYKVGDELIRHGEIMVVISTDYSLKHEQRLAFKRRVVWEEAYGKIPEGHKIIHLDGDHMNCNLDNLYCIPNRFTYMINKNGWLTDNREHTLAALKLCELIFALSDLKK